MVLRSAKQKFVLKYRTIEGTSFRDLPYELRCQVYEYVLPEAFRDLNPGQTGWRRSQLCFFIKQQYNYPLPNLGLLEDFEVARRLLSVCKVVNADVNTLLFSNYTPIIPESLLYEEYFRRMSPIALRCIRKLDITQSPGSKKPWELLCSIKKTCPNVREVKLVQHNSQHAWSNTLAEICAARTLRSNVKIAVEYVDRFSPVIGHEKIWCTMFRNAWSAVSPKQAGYIADCIAGYERITFATCIKPWSEAMLSSIRGCASGWGFQEDEELRTTQVLHFEWQREQCEEELEAMFFQQLEMLSCKQLILPPVTEEAVSFGRSVYRI